ncbi:hypothetical protein GLOTRDRAFT_140281 [Gloeophyllum trabeum ATCC 11539]|uniref:Uncharacterized protein n=1 Tax=Gloeophyllum trabeum (strain ATCC 11539 / FP-39264 / Madison 617) TaxID=670483 RepID=S7RIZ4_GLOTA|nr:uncharacterized protein GLOTRDRAFT_140281 [Gloeophyllum trabeum ATCC 11539]EPQ52584.1 hypothetical protein GLOTRDRAFT_140281 [Gloeophyllum trabeum ATCC 11539]
MDASGAQQRNDRILATLHEKLRAENVGPFSAACHKLARWLKDPRAYYTSARPKIVDLLETAANNARKHSLDPTPAGQSSNRIKAAQTLAAVVLQHADLFVEPELKHRLAHLVRPEAFAQNIVASPPVPVPSQHRPRPNTEPSQAQAQAQAHTQPQPQAAPPQRLVPTASTSRAALTTSSAAPMPHQVPAASSSSRPVFAVNATLAIRQQQRHAIQERRFSQPTDIAPALSPYPSPYVYYASPPASGIFPHQHQQQVTMPAPQPQRHVHAARPHLPANANMYPHVDPYAQTHVQSHPAHHPQSGTAMPTTPVPAGSATPVPAVSTTPVPAVSTTPIQAAATARGSPEHPEPQLSRTKPAKRARTLDQLARLDAEYCRTQKQRPASPVLDNSPPTQSPALVSSPAPETPPPSSPPVPRQLSARKSARMGTRRRGPPKASRESAGPATVSAPETHLLRDWAAVPVEEMIDYSGGFVAAPMAEVNSAATATADTAVMVEAGVSRDSQPNRVTPAHDRKAMDVDAYTESARDDAEDATKLTGDPRGAVLQSEKVDTHKMLVERAEDTTALDVATVRGSGETEPAPQSVKEAPSLEDTQHVGVTKAMVEPAEDTTAPDAAAAGGPGGTDHAAETDGEAPAPYLEGADKMLLNHVEDATAPDAVAVGSTEGAPAANEAPSLEAIQDDAVDKMAVESPEDTMPSGMATVSSEVARLGVPTAQASSCEYNGQDMVTSGDASANGYGVISHETRAASEAPAVSLKHVDKMMVEPVEDAMTSDVPLVSDFGADQQKVQVANGKPAASLERADHMVVEPTENPITSDSAAVSAFGPTTEAPTLENNQSGADDEILIVPANNTRTRDAAAISRSGATEHGIQATTEVPSLEITQDASILLSSADTPGQGEASQLHEKDVDSDTSAIGLARNAVSEPPDGLDAGEILEEPSKGESATVFVPRAPALEFSQIGGEPTAGHTQVPIVWQSDTLTQWVAADPVDPVASTLEEVVGPLTSAGHSPAHIESTRDVVLETAGSLDANEMMVEPGKGESIIVADSRAALFKSSQTGEKLTVDDTQVPVLWQSETLTRWVAEPVEPVPEEEPGVSAFADLAVPRTESADNVAPKSADILDADQMLVDPSEGESTTVGDSRVALGDAQDSTVWRDETLTQWVAAESLAPVAPILEAGPSTPLTDSQVHSTTMSALASATHAPNTTDEISVGSKRPRSTTPEVQDKDAGNGELTTGGQNVAFSDEIHVGCKRPRSSTPEVPGKDDNEATGRASTGAENGTTSDEVHIARKRLRSTTPEPQAKDDHLAGELPTGAPNGIISDEAMSQQAGPVVNSSVDPTITHDLENRPLAEPSTTSGTSEDLSGPIAPQALEDERRSQPPAQAILTVSAPTAPSSDARIEEEEHDFIEKPEGMSSVAAEAGDIAVAQEAAAPESLDVASREKDEEVKDLPQTGTTEEGEITTPPAVHDPLPPEAKPSHVVTVAEDVSMHTDDASLLHPDGIPASIVAVDPDSQVPLSAPGPSAASPASILYALSCATGTRQHILDFILKPDDYAAVQRWAHRKSMLDDSFTDGICLSLACYRLEDLASVLNGVDSIGTGNCNSLPKVEWPRTGCMWTVINGDERKGLVYLVPQYSANEDKLVDISSYLRQGENMLEISYDGNMSDYAVVLHAHHPTPSQIGKEEKRREKDREWAEFLKELAQPPKLRKFNWVTGVFEDE